MNRDKSIIISNIAAMLLENNKTAAEAIIHQEYPHTYFEIEKRTYTLTEKMLQFINDGFIDRYTGKKLLNPGILKIISHYFPNDFPYHPHWKMTETHIAYWELIPTLDHIYPLARGGADTMENRVTTSMKNNSIKSNYTIEEIQWNLYPKGSIADWDGLTDVFLKLVHNNKELLEDPYIKNWYNASKTAFFHHDKLKSKSDV